MALLAWTSRRDSPNHVRSTEIFFPARFRLSNPVDTPQLQAHPHKGDGGQWRHSHAHTGRAQRAAAQPFAFGKVLGGGRVRSDGWVWCLWCAVVVARSTRHLPPALLRFLFGFHLKQNHGWCAGSTKPVGTNRSNRYGSGLGQYQTDSNSKFKFEFKKMKNSQKYFKMRRI